MSYLVLARKWRPKNFAELVGQEHVVRALTNGLATGRIHHAFLFTGTRGVGKTTIARIIAKALNCETGISATPCGNCSACTEIDQGRFVDLLEIDAASRTKVDDTRDLLDNVVYAPARGRYKVYLIDEVHMLSTHSFNALLKTLEEPPPHVKFVLATTDPQKLPVTVLSRCLKFHLKRLGVAQIAGQMARILDAEGITSEPAALEELARAADGSMRDGLSLLDQAIGFGGGSVKADVTREMLGAVARDSLLDLLLAVAAGDQAQVWQLLQQIVAYNPGYQTVCGQLMELLHDAALQQVFGRDAEILELAPKVHALAQAASAEQLQLLYQIALLASRDLGLAPDPRVAFEMAVLRMLAFAPVSAAGPAGGGTAGPAGSGAGGGGARGAVPRLPIAAPSVATASDHSDRVALIVATGAPIRSALATVTSTSSAPARAAPTVPAALAADTPGANPAAVTALHAQILDRFAAVVAQLGLNGPQAEQVRSLCVRRFDAERLELVLPRELAYLLADASRLALIERLRGVLPAGTEVTLDAGERCSPTLGERHAVREAERASGFLAKLEDDPMVLALKREFDARLLPQTVVLPPSGGLQ